MDKRRKPHSKEHRQKISEANKGKLSGEKNPMYGVHFHHTEETKGKIALSNTGKKRTSEANCKQALRMSGRIIPEEIRQKIAISLSKRILSDSHKQKLREVNTGEKNPAWRGGISYEPYPIEFIYIRPRILERDNYTCQLCGSKSGLHVHHIDYDKEHNTMDNLITLCLSCHGALNAHIFRKDSKHEMGREQYQNAS